MSFTGLIAFIVVLGAALVAVAELLDPTMDTSQIVDGLTGIITGILGALLGLLAGKADAVNITPPPGMRPTGAVLVLAWAGMFAALLLLIVHGVQIVTGADTTPTTTTTTIV